MSKTQAEMVAEIRARATGAEAQLLDLRAEIIQDTHLSEDEREDLKLAVFMLIMYLKHRK